MKITDKVLNDIFKAYYGDKREVHRHLLKETKRRLKDQGYEVEEPKSKLDEIIELKNEFKKVYCESKCEHNDFDMLDNIHTIILKKYDLLIEEIQNDCDYKIKGFSYIKSQFEKIVDYGQENSDKYNWDVGSNIFDNVIKELKQKPKIDDDLIEWLEWVADVSKSPEKAQRLLKQLGVNND